MTFEHWHYEEIDSNKHSFESKESGRFHDEKMKELFEFLLSIKTYGAILKYASYTDIYRELEFKDISLRDFKEELKFHEDGHELDTLTLDFKSQEESIKHLRKTELTAFLDAKEMTTNEVQFISNSDELKELCSYFSSLGWRFLTKKESFSSKYNFLVFFKDYDTIKVHNFDENSFSKSDIYEISPYFDATVILKRI